MKKFKVVHLLNVLKSVHSLTLTQYSAVRKKQASIKRIMNKFYKVLLLLLLIILLIVYTQKMRYETVSEYEKRMNITTNTKNLKKILLYNDFFNKKDYDIGLGQKHFLRNCEVKSCMTIAGDDNPYPLSEMDALVYHSWSKKKKLPEERHPHTRYVFFLRESPIHAHNDLLKTMDGVFNYTMTHRLDADIPLLYGTTVKRNASIVLKDMEKVMNSKTTTAAWVVSHCPVHSQRDKIVKALKKHISVDQYGLCSKKDCASGVDSCYKLIEKKYKFYLAFENSLCLDYITEKFYTYAQYYVVPVVYGGADYEKLAPPHSYINVRDFDNVTHLANYINYLDKNDTAYLQYFEWKKDYSIEVDGIGGSSFCQLCAKLHKDKTTKVYENFYSWFEENKCESPEEFLKAFLR